MSGKIIGYKRVSSLDQQEFRQLDGLTLDKIYIDKASGANTERSQLKAMLDFLREGDTLKIHSMDRLARNLDDLRKIVNELVAKGVRVEFVKENLIFTADASPMSQLLLNMMGAFATFELQIIRERHREGIEIAKRKGTVYKGRKQALSPDQASHVLARLNQGEKPSTLAKEFKITRQTITNYQKRLKPPQEACHRSPF